MNYEFKILVISSICACTAEVQAQIVINEVMQSNIDCLMDNLNEFPDSWVELCNVGTATRVVSGYSIGEHPDGRNAYALPTTSLAAGGYQLVYCDKEETGWHTSFRLDTGKNASLYLFDAEGNAVDSVIIAKKQPSPNIAYGRETDGSAAWGYQLTPTPGEANCGRLCDTVLGEPIFSIPGQVLTSSRNLSLTLSLPPGCPEGTEIRYTTDGSEPTAASTLYSSEIHMSSTRVIRAKLFKEGCLSPRSTTQSYVFLGRPMTLPVISIVTNRSYFYDSKIGIYVDGTYNSSKKNYQYDWRRPINLEYYESPDSSLLNQLCETRIAGAASRGCQYKTLAIYANKRFGEKHFDHEFFPDQRPGQQDYKSLVLRNAGNDFDYLYMRDAICQRAMASHVDLDWQAWRPAIIYINGTYTGILNIRERANESNIYTNYDHLEDIDLIENWDQLKEGTMEAMDAFSAFYNEHGHTYQEYDALMDMDEYINLMVMDTYFNNVDFPGNNIVLWRPREEGGRWRFIAKDVDYTMGLYGQQAYNYNYISWLNNHDYDSSCQWANNYDDTRLFRRLEEDETFVREFCSRFVLYMNQFLNADSIWSVWEPMYNLIKTEYPNHRKLINQWWPTYSDEVSKAKTWLQKRNASLLSQLQNYYGLGAPMQLNINMALNPKQLADFEVTFNGLTLANGCYTGKFFGGHEIRLSASNRVDAGDVPLSDLKVQGWTVVTYGTDGKTEVQEVEGSSCTLTMPTSCANLMILAKIGEDEGVEQVTADSVRRIIAIRDIHGRLRAQLQTGCNVVSYSDGTVEKVYCH